ncbi:inositol monophosphatase [Dasania sp. GY-MA-18]|uniref:Inositol-1-monophosphatase n=1 Tax=Dasania phycosphaerae TaxID=2950436 RepID=A0A9J6RQI3_9GAMM|nr:MULTISPECIES: inositol monophosphatase family protein [Dasania]MCR8924182.1 inositol monophosphatase [Dasania sp. GY-MA-18]MCZ0866835.1 inositol monophosphatase family protein [Dasania phycosphaerae]MCZ0870340.1 inositol monophosphatase family protein [Dasania phycosphaerae]
MQPMTTIALRAARKAGEIIARACENLDTIDIESKGNNDFVTEVDKAAEREIRYGLSKAYPDHAILGEEGGLIGSPDADYQWVVDPLDGTTNFIRGIPHFAISIACFYKGQIEHAVILDPIRREEFIASRGRGAQLNGRRIRVSKRTTLEGALIGTGIPYKSRSEQHIPEYMASLEAVTRQTAGIRRGGAAALDLAYVAAGRLDGFWEIGLNKWDIAAGILLIREAGGLVSDFKGGNDYLESGNIVTGNPKTFKALLQTVQPHLKQTAK